METIRTSLSAFRRRVNGILSGNSDSFKGAVIEDVSVEDDLRERVKSRKYGDFVYLNGYKKEAKGTEYVSLRIRESRLKSFMEEYPVDYSLAGKSYDFTVESVSVGSRGNLVVEVSSIVENGVSEKERLFIKLDSYCREMGYYEREKKELRFPVTRIAAFTSGSSSIETDVLNNAGLKREFIWVRKCSSPGELSKAIMEANERGYDACVLFRGGREDQSLRELFFSKQVIDAVAESEIPVISALGHDVDVPFISRITDGDYSTPSAFAKAVRSGNEEALREIDRMAERTSSFFNGILRGKANLVKDTAGKTEKSFRLVLTKKASRLSEIPEKLNATVGKIEAERERALAEKKAKAYLAAVVAVSAVASIVIFFLFNR